MEAMICNPTRRDILEEWCESNSVIIGGCMFSYITDIYWMKLMKDRRKENIESCIGVYKNLCGEDTRKTLQATLV